MGRTMLCENNLPKYLWAEAVNTACFIINRVMIRSILKKTPYELFNDRKPNVSHLRPFGCKVFVLNNGKDNLGKFDAKSDEGIFLGYSLNSKAYRVFNKRTLIIEESIHVLFEESNSAPRKGDIVDDVGILEQIEGLDINKDDGEVDKIEEDGVHEEELQPTQVTKEPVARREREYVKDNEVIGNPTEGVRTRSALREYCDNVAFISNIEPKNIFEVNSR
ncbi:hypothetical protein CFOL_v3_02234 [Cephalotus follicularis]|uniref:Retroviral polymerase SH3-like domain-containing protein n=1 Tax=Cephalotus follicularis TaxID=3775 RepID=A0A1Q3ASJ5_CEPFO|nr:hypothetical protein CFOL_v3_02234 [Cephalotus follicularis]